MHYLKEKKKKSQDLLFSNNYILKDTKFCSTAITGVEKLPNTLVVDKLGKIHLWLKKNLTTVFLTEFSTKRTDMHDLLSSRMGWGERRAWCTV